MIRSVLCVSCCPQIFSVVRGASVAQLVPGLLDGFQTDGAEQTVTAKLGRDHPVFSAFPHCRPFRALSATLTGRIRLVLAFSSAVGTQTACSAFCACSGCSFASCRKNLLPFFSLLSAPVLRFVFSLRRQAPPTSDATGHSVLLSARYADAVRFVVGVVCHFARLTPIVPP